jgi:hypothetical protein
MAIAWIGIVPFRTPGKIDKPLHDVGGGSQQRRKSPVRRCFKSCLPFGGIHRFAPAAGFYERLTGLLSRSPLTDTRPQARAIWAKRKIGMFCRNTSVFFIATLGRLKFFSKWPKDSPCECHVRLLVAPCVLKRTACNEPRRALPTYPKRINPLTSWRLGGMRKSGYRFSAQSS